MNKIKAIRPIIFIATFGITLFLIYASTTITLTDRNSNHNRNSLSTSAKNNAILYNAETSTSTIDPLSDGSSGTYSDQRIGLLNEQDRADENVISRGISSRTTYHKENQAEKTITPTTASATPIEETRTATAQSAAPVEVASNTEIQPSQSTQAKVDTQYEDDLDLLSRLITAEAQGEPYEAKVAVGAVVMNRVQSGLWAATITDVIYQNINGYYQFTPVANGWINKPAEPESIKAAQAAMNGADPTNGAQFYYDDKSTNTWILSKPVSLQIGHMIYAY